MTCDEAWASLREIMGLDGVEVRGFMTMAPQGDPQLARQTFAGLRELRDELCATCDGAVAPSELSMGMSEDFEEAIAQGATIIRLGRVAFDPSFPLK